MSSGSGPRVFDSREWITVTEESNGKSGPVPPAPDGDGSIFVSIVSYRDGERCGETLRSLFENAIHPDKVVVGLFEQNAPEDKFCLEQYCSYVGTSTLKRQTIREGVTKIMVDANGRRKCPHYDQVRLLAYHDIQAKGPTYARSMVRKVLGNEEFCMQIDAHSDFVKGWDEVAVSEWKNTQNEFGILSNVPASKADKDQYTQGATKFAEVPRQCSLKFQANGVPDYASPADGKAVDLTKPLLGHGWSAAFSFAKCHLEESAPYDSFSYFAMPIEQFSRFARLWTRGYDVYTPTRNIVFHDYGEQANGHGANEWFKRQRDRFRQGAINRAKTLLQLPISGGDVDINAQANLGIYGLGKRRTLDQLSAFTHVDLKENVGNLGQGHCTGHEWVPYDASISPTENLFTNPSNLDPQPLFPRRTQLVFYERIDELPPDSEAGIITTADRNLRPSSSELVDRFDGGASNNGGTLSTGILFVFWIFGILVWFMVFLPHSFHAVIKSHSRTTSSSQKKPSHMYKDV